MAGNPSCLRRSSPLLSNFLDLANRIRTSFTPNPDFNITTLESDYLNFSTMQGDNRQSYGHFAMSNLGAIHAQEEKTLRTLLELHEHMREEPDYEQLARIWRTSLGQSEVVNGETAALVLPPVAAAKARVSRLPKRGANAELQQRPKRRT